MIMGKFEIMLRSGNTLCDLASHPNMEGEHAIQSPPFFPLLLSLPPLPSYFESALHLVKFLNLDLSHETRPSTTASTFGQPGSTIYHPHDCQSAMSFDLNNMPQGQLFPTVTRLRR